VAFEGEGQLPMPDAKYPTHTSPWTDGDTAAAVYLCPAVVVSLLTTYQWSPWAGAAAGGCARNCVSDWPLMEWWRMSKGVGRWGRGGNWGSRV